MEIKPDAWLVEHTHDYVHVYLARPTYLDCGCKVIPLYRRAKPAGLREYIAGLRKRANERPSDNNEYQRSMAEAEYRCADELEAALNDKTD